ncbi:competence CoiA-like predicted nuclease [Chryseobacterium sediminis]|uniref:Competence CoiA-like predicted nuclease n=1 Tax=Chryseobacterium sediminis TaxID=1679494 RepID=A0ABR6Q4T9_9FLAO|nr:hypothetical protein [Chryseobacterium sediminis]MBB6332981.1 competence CoiA-like predicted nuclease [Chryseobacterium sediminis]
MTKKIVLSLFLLVIGYFFYNPMIISLAAIKDPEPINFKPDQIFKLKDIPELKNSQNVVVYIVLAHEDRKNIDSIIPKWKVLQSGNSSVIENLLNCKFKYNSADVSTIQSKMYVYSNNTLVFESEISLDKNLGIQNRVTGWATPVDHKQFLSIISQFDRYNLPVLIIK